MVAPVVHCHHPRSFNMIVPSRSMPQLGRCPSQLSPHLPLHRPGRSLTPSWVVQHDSAKPFDAPAREVPVTAFPTPPIACSCSFYCVHFVQHLVVFQFTIDVHFQLHLADGDVYMYTCVMEREELIWWCVCGLLHPRPAALVHTLSTTSL
ncbi:uncharacterized protein [Triticum aestivum]|uniref:uncharacterized protein n=1 Tax=Triticum aestivum TaxID=4565 RepID=UPI001D035889|nr:uncharacterized protein LOC123121262 [Triticum aestivum]